MGQDGFGLAAGQRKRKRADANQIIIESFRTEQRYEIFHRLIRLASDGPYRRMSDVHFVVSMPTDEFFEDPINVLIKELERRVT